MTKEKKHAEPVEEATEEAVEATDSVSVSPDVEQLVAERDALAAVKAELEDRLLRRAAEFDNFRKRTERERLDWFETAGMEAIESLLPVLDDFERALKVESPDKEYANGMQLIFRRLMDTLKKQGLEPIEAAGQAFDPNVHHAVEMVETAETEDHVVLEDLRRGYNFKGRLLRPAMVRVAVTPAE